ncbi:uncharacterized protein LOC143200216 [Rhynchophorus ferrugineus]|uniref:uncharacterized protein LOC143200216 n=1 Tax=Rhynchophorus ferrugineus TaxID=354439 RepID=UPI003FCC2D36
MKIAVLVVVSFCIVTSSGQSSTSLSGIRMVLKICQECYRSDFTKCLKKKAITFLDRLGRVEKLPVMDGVAFVKSSKNPTNSVLLTENEIDQNLARSLEGEGKTLNKMLIDKASDIFGARSIEISIPKIASLVKTEGRSEHHHKNDTYYTYYVERRRRRRRPEHSHHTHHNKWKKIGETILTAITAALSALVPVAIALIALIAGAALILSKVALAATIIIAAKKLMPPKKEEAHIIESHIVEPHITEPHIVKSHVVEPHITESQVASPHDEWHGNEAESWQSSGGDWDQRSMEEAHLVAYRAQKPL